MKIEKKLHALVEFSKNVNYTYFDAFLRYTSSKFDAKKCCSRIQKISPKI